jgi:hypothetical protein
VTDVVNSPPHYLQGGIECFDAIEAMGIGKEACRANAVKYLWRMEHKGKALEDARKAQWYVARLVSQLEKEYAATCNPTSTPSSCALPKCASAPTTTPSPSTPPLEPSSSSECEDSSHPFWMQHVLSH